jgi:hypothetical protein
VRTALIPRSVSILTSNRKTVGKSANDDGIIRPSSSSTLVPQTTSRTGISSGAIAGIVIASLVVGASLLLATYLLRRRRRAARIAQANLQAADPFPMAEGSTQPQGGGDTIVIAANPAPRRQKESPPPTLRGGSNNTGRSAPVGGTTSTPRSLPSYVVAVKTDAGSR